MPIPNSIPDPQALVAGAELAYASDYLSFVGADAAGRVAFAIDTNRGRDGEPFQADHLFIVLHDERRGWVRLAGAGRYPNPYGMLLSIPDSPSFQFSGTPAAGLTLDSPHNRLTLTIEPLVERMTHGDADSFFQMRSAAAVLRWRDRVLPGRVIAEILVGRGWNMITRRTFKSLAGLEYLYLLAGESGDLYLQKQNGQGALLRGMPPLLGFRATAQHAQQLADLRVQTRRHDLAPGAYRWPAAWRGSWRETEGRTRFALRTTARTTVGNWGVAGFSMAVVRGVLREDGHTTPLYGLGELLSLSPLLRWIV